MKEMTKGERELLCALETQADRMNNIRAILDILDDWDPFSDEHIREEARPARRMCAIRMLESTAHLAQFYHDDAMRVVDSYYHADR
ncbi:MAG: hypothetical protein IJ313_09355 [Clostridia bacterium]|nr:hypothetical protein [Clostridia bacterium]